VDVCVCERERETLGPPGWMCERESARAREREREREREGENRARERERARVGYILAQVFKHSR
jgi:predicted O-linked N-acetylglucosamine transferase (SPINDLY family)